MPKVVKSEIVSGLIEYFGMNLASGHPYTVNLIILYSLTQLHIFIFNVSVL